MPTTSHEQLGVYMEQIDAETTRIAEYIANQVTQLINETITAEQLQTNIQPRLDALIAMGQEPPPPTP